MKKFRKYLFAVAAALLPVSAFPLTLYTCGDSTMADYATDGSTPTRGWGQYFGAFFNSGIDVVNRGKGGMDVQGFYNNQAYWPTIKEKLEPGDYVLLQFAHNDEKNGGMDGYQLRDYYLSVGDNAAAAAVDLRGSVPHDTYVKMLRKLVEEIRAKDAIPLFATSVCRMYFTSDGKDIKRNGRHDLGDNFDKLTANGPTKGNKVGADDHSMDYTWQMQNLAKELDVPCIDLTEATRKLYLSYGQEKTAQIISDGAGGTHFSAAGAAMIARRAAELMVEADILADYITLGDAELAILGDSDFGSAYAGNILTNEYTVTAFGLEPTSGKLTVSATAPFEVSADKSVWADQITIDYTGGNAIGTFYSRVALKKPVTEEGTITVTAGAKTVSLDVTATAKAVPGSGAVKVVWPLSDDMSAVGADGLTLIPVSVKGLDVKGYNSGIELTATGGWPAGDIDESPTRYIEFGVSVPEGKNFTVSGLSLNVGGAATDGMQVHATYSTDAAFGNPRQFYAPAAMADGAMNLASTETVVTIPAGGTLLLRVYPWTKEASSSAVLRIADVTISGYVENTTASATLLWPLDKGTANPSVADTASDAFAFTGYSVGKDLKVAGTGKPVNTTGTNYQPVINNQSGYSADASVAFTLRPKNGITFQPKKVSFYATRNGTDGGKMRASFELDGTEIELAKDFTPCRNNTEPKQTYYEFPIEGVVVYNNTLTFRLGIYSLGNSKTYTIHSVKIEGVTSGTEVAVPSYSITATASDPDAGTVTVEPSSAKIDSGVEVTLTATENFGYKFLGWTEAGKTVSTANPFVFPAERDMALVANYEKLTVYPLNLSVQGGANDYLVTVAPQGHMIDDVPYYVAGTEVVLTAANNRILSFTNWDDNTTALERTVRMDGEKNIVANYSADDYIVGWDFYHADPKSERAADYAAESDNAGKLSIRNEAGATTSWLAHAYPSDENGRYTARIWKNRSEKYYFEISFGAKGYTDIKVASAMMYSFMTYTRFFLQYSTDGQTYRTAGEIVPGNRQWVDTEFALPGTDNAERVYVRWMPDFDAPLDGSTTDLDGVCLSDIYVLASSDASSDDVAPVLTSSIPADGSKGASVSGSVVLTYDEKVKLTGSKATLDGKELSGTVAGKTVVFRYTGLNYNTDYTFTLPAGAVTDRNGNAAAAASISFTTMERTQPQPRLYDAVVDIDGSGDYTSVQAAIDAAPAGLAKPWLIFVHNGRYKEHVDIPSTKPFIHITGQDREKTVILDDRLCGGDNAVHVSVGATVVVNSNDCMFENITLENSYGHELQKGPQALALNTIGDRTIFNNVGMLSYQDTWITPSKSSHRAYVKNSFIEGAVDFIYNSGDIYIENTTLYINRLSGGYIVAPSHGNDVAWGYVFRDCTITAPGDPSKTSIWLGRPWHNAPKTVFLNTRAEVTIPAAGWYETMGGLPAVFAEWNTHDAEGKLLDLSQRRDTYYVTNSDGTKTYAKAKRHITDEEAAEYTRDNVLGGTDAWQPAIKTEACNAPQATFDGSTITWAAVPYAICYLITAGDEVVGFTTDTAFTPEAKSGETYHIQAVNEYGGVSEKALVGQSGVDGVDVGAYEVVAIYDVEGRRLTSPAHGVNIIISENAAGMRRTEKVVVR